KNSRATSADSCTCHRMELNLNRCASSRKSSSAVPTRLQISLSVHPAWRPTSLRLTMAIPWSTSPKACRESISENWAGSSRFRSSFSYLTVTIIPMSRSWRNMSGPLIPIHWELELWDEYRLLERVRNQFGVDVNSLEHDRLLDMRIVIDRAKGIYA